MDRSALARQVESVERSIIFLRQEQLTLLHGLHLEILSLQKRCTGKSKRLHILQHMYMHTFAEHTTSVQKSWAGEHSRASKWDSYRKCWNASFSQQDSWLHRGSVRSAASKQPINTASVAKKIFLLTCLIMNQAVQSWNVVAGMAETVWYRKLLQKWTNHNFSGLYESI